MKTLITGAAGFIGSTLALRLLERGDTVTGIDNPNDNYDLANSHVLPALIRKAHEAKLRNDPEYVVWGTGTPKREFLYVDDMADACVFLMEHNISEGIYNVGTGTDVTIRELAETVMDVIGFQGKVVFDSSKPDGTMRKLLDVSRMKQLGWQAKTGLRAGIEQAYAVFLATLSDGTADVFDSRVLRS